jgi:hypothetical protein
MSQKDSNGRRLRAGFSLASLAGGALVTAALSMGTAHADTPIIDVYSPPDPYDVLFGAEGGLTANSQGADNALLDSNLSAANLGVFQTDVAAFEGNAAEHGISNLINAIDPSAFAEQVGGGAVGTIASAGDAYLVPESALGYLAVGLDYGLLTPTGLDFVLTPLIDILTGTPFG